LFTAVHRGCAEIGVRDDPTPRREVDYRRLHRLDPEVIAPDPPYSINRARPGSARISDMKATI
jgi:hypothetical protein